MGTYQSFVIEGSLTCDRQSNPDVRWWDIRVKVPLRTIYLCTAALSFSLWDTFAASRELAKVIPHEVIASTAIISEAIGWARRLVIDPDSALSGHDVPKYESGEQQRSTEIEDGVTRSAVEVITDLQAGVDSLEEIFTQSTAAGWPNGHFLGALHYGVASCQTN